MASQQRVSSLTCSESQWRCRSSCRICHGPSHFNSMRTCRTTSNTSCLICSCRMSMSAAVTMPAHDSLLLLLKLLRQMRNLESPQLAPLATTVGATLPCQVELSFVATTSSEGRCALCKSEVHMQMDRERRRCSGRGRVTGRERAHVFDPHKCCRESQ